MLGGKQRAYTNTRTQRLNHFETFSLSKDDSNKSRGSRAMTHDADGRLWESVCSYLFSDHTHWLPQPKLPPRSDLRSTTAPQADSHKYISSRHKIEETHLDKKAPHQQAKEKKKKGAERKRYIMLHTSVWGCVLCILLEKIHFQSSFFHSHSRVQQHLRSAIPNKWTLYAFYASVYGNNNLIACIW